MTTEQDPRLTRAAQLRADAAVMRQAAKVRERNSWMAYSPTSLLGNASDLESAAAALEAEVQAEIDAKAAETVDEWAEAKGIIDGWEMAGWVGNYGLITKYVRHLQGCVAELENSECERINDSIAALDAEIAGLRAENERLKNDIEATRETDNNTIGNIERMDICLDEYERDKRYYPLMTLDYVQAAVHYRRKYREAEAKLASVPKVWMVRKRSDGQLLSGVNGEPAVYVSDHSDRVWEAIPYDGRKSVAP